jgi:hypothetical protein
MNWLNELDFFLPGLSSLVRCLQARPELTQVKHLSVLHVLSGAPALAKQLNRLQRPTREKHSSLFYPYISYKGEKLYTIDTCGHFS